MTYLVFTPKGCYVVTRSEFVALLKFNEWSSVVWDRNSHDFSIKVASSSLVAKPHHIYSYC